MGRKKLVDSMFERTFMYLVQVEHPSRFHPLVGLVNHSCATVFAYACVLVQIWRSFVSWEANAGWHYTVIRDIYNRLVGIYATLNRVRLYESLLYESLISMGNV